MILKNFRPASAMIELIFAIVVMGIALLSAPMMLETAGKSNNVAFEQESIAIVAAQVSSMLTYAWDEQNTQTFAPRGILTVSSTGDSRLDGNNRHLNILRKTSVLPSATTATFGMNRENEITGGIIHFEAIPDDVDDFDNTDSNLTIAESGSQASQFGDIMDTSIRIRTQVTYLDDTAKYANATGVFAFSKNVEGDWDAITAGSTNIKLITTTLSSSNVAGKKIKLRAFMCNMGAAQPNTRTGI